MAKKKNQSTELNLAALELLKRNEPEKARFEEWVKRLEGKIAREELEKTIVRPSVISYRFLSDEDVESGKYLSSDDLAKGKRWGQDIYDIYGPWGYGNPLNILTMLTYSDPYNTLLLGIDLSRSKEAIMADVEKTLDLHKEKIQNRHKWLSKTKEILHVWDLWVEGGEPARQAFPTIAKRLKVPESTVKDRWYLAYELIYGKPYENDPAKRREQRIDKAEKLCLRCTDPICGNKNGGDEIGCPAYVALAGKNTPRDRTDENFNTIADRQSYKAYLETEYNTSDDE